MENQVVLFDGVCNLCNASVQTLIKLDKKGVLKFASLQSDFGQKVLVDNNLDQQNFNTFLYYKNQKLYSRSTAAIYVFSELGIVFQGVKIFLLVPKFIRDGIYNYVSKNRYKWFGRKESCWLPTPELKERFIE